MLNVDEPIEVVDMETLSEFLEEQQERPYHNSFFDSHEPEILDDYTYRQVEFKKYGYAVKDSDDSW